ncbi:MAG: hypothetical protein IT342_15545 [Candidatus Melainabacteria bacterium]|nr:hypothetical protein [Candidatus Melainabacteria bacterium]
MKNALQTATLVACCVSLCCASSQAQSILNQSNDDLLKGFEAGKSLTAPSLSGPASVGPAQPTWAPQGSAPGANTGAAAPGVLPQNSSPPGTYQPPPQLLGQPQVQKGLLQRVIEGAMNAVNVSSNDAEGTHVKVPFVNVDVGGKNQGGVKVKAPFVNINRGYNGTNARGNMGGTAPRALGDPTLQQSGHSPLPSGNSGSSKNPAEQSSLK